MNPNAQAAPGRTREGFGPVPDERLSRIRGYDAGVSIRGEGPPLVLVPGMDGTGNLFYRQVPRLARAYRVATYSLRDDTARMEVLVRDLAAVIDRVGGDAPCLVLGESFGGALGLSLALTCPQRVAALVVLNSFPRFLPQARLHLAIEGLKLLPWGAIGFVRRLTASRLHSDHTGDAEIDRFLELMCDTTKEGYLNRLRILTRYDVRDRLERIRIPTLLLAADEDRLVPSVEQARAMAGRIPGASLRILEGHGHACLIAPDLDLLQILSEWDRRPSPREA